MALHIGLISGTSTDAVDAAIVEVSPDRIELIAWHSEPIPKDISLALRSVIDNQLMDRSSFWQLDIRVGELFAQATRALLEHARIEASQVRAIGSHGQTVFHAPDAEFPCTVQIGDPNVIAERTGITTVADLRRRDLAAGGQGAPLAPAFHDAVFRTQNHDRVVINIGGIGNLTLLPADASLPATGFDTGPGNTLMDVWAGRVRDVAMDVDGQWARSGQCHQRLLDLFKTEPYFALAPPKSTGRELFNLPWIDGYLSRLGEDVAAEDVQRTLSELTVDTITEAVRKHAPETREVLICGGGVHNPLTMERLTQALRPIDVHSTMSIGFDPDWVEAAAFAWLAARAMDAMPGNLPAVTGATHPVILGGIYAGG
ncbi:MAG: anhydro-N-acetylmuramic acid kinase [Gammaproteobacteria bacterium]|jgi:anhydro-N-acetylmuramic acid kinase|nr:anhydro-N-acetylmuramic acid kinase [Gammaproteobacteria bacterium]